MTGQLLARLADLHAAGGGVQVVVGASGSGKSSLLRAGLKALRMRPDCLVMGEVVRGPEVCELPAALNTGHQGGVGTEPCMRTPRPKCRHGWRLWPHWAVCRRHALYSQLAAAVHVVLHVVRCDGARRPSAVECDGDLVRVLSAWQDGRWGLGEHRLWDLLNGHGGGAVC